MLYSPRALPEAPLVAVASNFADPMKEIAAAFEDENGVSPRLSFGSSGKFYAQITHGAPFDLFLSADEKTVSRLISDGLAVSDSRITYAEGRLVLWTRRQASSDLPGRLQRLDFRRLALASPRVAPYGLAATQVLEYLGILETSRDYWVLGENIAQAYLFAASGNADLGLVAASQVTSDGEITSGTGFIVPAEWHTPIRQDAILLMRSESQSASELLEFLDTQEVRQIIRRYGYR